MESPDPCFAAPLANEMDDPLFHLLRGLVGEGNRQNLPRRHAPLGNEIGNSMRKHASLPRSGAGEDQQRTFRMLDGLALNGI